MPTSDDGAWCWPGGGTDLSRHCRCAGTLSEVKIGRSRIWIDTFPGPIRRARSTRRHITVWRRDDADDALRSGPDHIDAFGEMVLAQGLGDEDCQAPREKEGDCRVGA